MSASRAMSLLGAFTCAWMLNGCGAPLTEDLIEGGDGDAARFRAGTLTFTPGAITTSDVYTGVWNGDGLPYTSYGHVTTARFDPGSTLFDAVSFDVNGWPGRSECYQDGRPTGPAWTSWDEQPPMNGTYGLRIRAYTFSRPLLSQYVNYYPVDPNGGPVLCVVRAHTYSSGGHWRLVAEGNAPFAP